MLKIGLTGGIGSGKTTIAKIFSTLGVPLYDADTAAKKIMDTNDQVKKQLIARFGNKVYKNGALDRSYLSSIVFNDASALHDLNAITHPATIKDAEKWFSKQQTAYAIKEAALIFESKSHQYLDYVIGVWAPLPLRIERVLLRGGITEQEARNRAEKQMNEEQKMQLCDFVIDNSGTKAVIPQVIELHEKLIKLSQI